MDLNRTRKLAGLPINEALETDDIHRKAMKSSLKGFDRKLELLIKLVNDCVRDYRGDETVQKKCEEANALLEKARAKFINAHDHIKIGK